MSHEKMEAMLREKYPIVPAQHLRNLVFSASRVALLGDSLATATVQGETRRWLEQEHDPDGLCEMEALMAQLLDAMHMHVARSVEGLRALASRGAPCEPRASDANNGDIVTLRAKYRRVPARHIKTLDNAAGFLALLADGLTAMVAVGDPAIERWAQAQPDPTRVLLEQYRAKERVLQVVCEHADRRIMALRQAVVRGRSSI